MTDTWLTPRFILEDLGPFDLDPCAAPEPRPWPSARKHYVEADMGLLLPWDGVVWLNPPYSDPAPWMERMAAHGSGLALTFAKTGTSWFPWRSGLVMLFLRGRLRFCRPDGSPGDHARHPSVIIAYDAHTARRLCASHLEGQVVPVSPLVIFGPGAPSTWREAILGAMGGRQASLRDIYSAVGTTEKAIVAMSHGVKWREKIRRVLQEHFRPVARGVWAPA